MKQFIKSIAILVCIIAMMQLFKALTSRYFWFAVGCVAAALYIHFNWRINYDDYRI